MSEPSRPEPPPPGGTAPAFSLQVPRPRRPKARGVADHLAPLPDELRAGAFRQAMQFVGQGLNQATTWGEGNRPEDAAHWLDMMGDAFRRANPTLPCWQGCADCCEEAPFRVTRAEWESVVQALDAMPEAQRGPLLQAAWRQLGPQQEALHALAEAWTEGLSPQAPEATRQPCPLLAGPPGGRTGCSIYAHRPAMCRAYGHISAHSPEGKVFPLFCHQRGPGWLQAQVDAGVQDLPWPRWEPLWEQVVRLSGGPGTWIAPLGWWLWREIEAGRWPEALPST